MTYDAASQLKGINRYADLASTQLVADSSYDYDVASRLKELKHFKGTDVLAAYGFDYDAGNRITSFSSPDGTSAYSYDLTNQLTGTDHSYQNSENYSYDDNGNRTNDGYDTGTDNRLLTDGKYNYSYDNEGNRTQRVEIATGEITEYSWDYRNRLTEVVVKDANGNVIKTSGYAYDMLDRRIAKEVDPDGDGVATASVERFVYDGEHIALTFDGNGTQTHRYLHGPMIDQVLADENAQGEVLWALADNQGTVRDVVEADGTVVNHITYDSFGKVTGESNSNVDFRFGYTGREFDEETGQYYYRARYYDAATGQFINQDPIGFAGGDSNLYRYVFNSPTNFNDPSGEFIVIGTAAVVGAGVLVAGLGYILSNPQAQEVIEELPRRLPNPFDNTPKPDLDPNNAKEIPLPDYKDERENTRKSPGGFRLGVEFDPNHINIHDGIPLKLPNLETFPLLNGLECLFPPFFESTGDGSGIINNKFPDEALDPDGKIFGEIKVANGKAYLTNGKPIPTGDLDFVITKDNRLLIGRKHTTLSAGNDVLAAGSLNLKKGKVRVIDNLSGHFRPTVEESRRYPELLQEMGLDTSGAHLKLYEIKADPNGNITTNPTLEVNTRLP